tara:strand:- start:329 stop:1615 length:1287 start_codon:yes stop_codon:yes gene_type:complete
MNTLETYKPNAHFKKITLQMIDKISALEIPKNDKFNFCKISLAQAIVNPLKVSYIKQDKIKSLMEHAKVILPLSPTAEQRNKYFNACSLEKFANHIFNKETINAEQLNEFNEIVKKAKERANATLTKKLRTFDAQQIPEIYNIKSGTDNETYNGLYIGKHNDINASCMQGKPRKWFEIYTDIEESQAVEMATLIQGNEIVARALVWFDVPVDEVGKNVISSEKIYIDRIYTKTQEHRAETQTELYFQILKNYNISNVEKIISAPASINDKNKKLGKTKIELILPNCYNACNLREKIRARLNTTKEIKFNSYCRFDVETYSDNYEFYPYLDSLQYFNTYDHRLTADEENGSDVLKLENTNGDANSVMCTCDNCGDSMHEEDSRFVETEEMNCCESCAIYCDGRDEWILETDAVYNNHSGEYHYRGDLDL